MWCRRALCRDRWRTFPNYVETVAVFVLRGFMHDRVTYAHGRPATPPRDSFAG